MRITEIVIACFKTHKMLAFYQNVFDISFESIEIAQGTIHVGFIDKIQITLCPATIAGITAENNRHQLTFLLNGNDMIAVVEKAKHYGGEILQEITETKEFLQTAIKDIDGNSIVLKEML